jgi:hypothetical protein
MKIRLRSTLAREGIMEGFNDQEGCGLVQSLGMVGHVFQNYSYGLPSCHSGGLAKH